MFLSLFCPVMPCVFQIRLIWFHACVHKSTVSLVLSFGKGPWKLLTRGTAQRQCSAKRQSSCISFYSMKAGPRFKQVVRL